ncbi:MAG: GTP cyclohydrolase I FolE2 [Candidatus Dadabacteria bacterium]|nr:GTP cyclohydrolase I FolE2 [Candidatus Dadabacteria bacterium]NIQ15090.1 GTP cyclohydrolase I FolE2 [Candidatus Dadabacteria bacterium]
METKYIEKITEDVQSRSDSRNVSIDNVGICDLQIPLVIYGCEKDPDKNQSINADVSLSVDLDKYQKGIHMSRLIETILEYQNGFSIHNFKDLLEDICNKQQSLNSYADVKFNYFFNKEAPVSGKTSPQAYKCIYKGIYTKSFTEIVQGVEVPVKTVCPCSKEISDYGAHNQRSKVWVYLTHRINNSNVLINISLEDIIEIAENCASSPLYPILKREDERHVTMSAYDKPCFVEDVIRNLAIALRHDDRFDSYELKVMNSKLSTMRAYIIITHLL